MRTASRADATTRSSALIAADRGVRRSSSRSTTSRLPRIRAIAWAPSMARCSLLRAPWRAPACPAARGDRPRGALRCLRVPLGHAGVPAAGQRPGRRGRRWRSWLTLRTLARQSGPDVAAAASEAYFSIGAVIEHVLARAERLRAVPRRGAGRPTPFARFMDVAVHAVRRLTRRVDGGGDLRRRPESRRGPAPRGAHIEPFRLRLSQRAARRRRAARVR